MKKSRKPSHKKQTTRRAAPAKRAPIGTPKIGGPWATGGIYAGLSLENERPVALILLPGDAGDLTWEQAKAWAAEKEASLPSRIDQLVLFKNVKSEFQGAWYWSGEPYAGDESWAWYQHFRDGGQDTSRKSSQLRAWRPSRPTKACSTKLRISACRLATSAASSSPTSISTSSTGTSSMICMRGTTSAMSMTSFCCTNRRSS